LAFATGVTFSLAPDVRPGRSIPTTLDELSAAVKEARAQRLAPSAPHSQSLLIPESPSL